jgi:hypothetical protein
VQLTVSGAQKTLEIEGPPKRKDPNRQAGLVMRTPEKLCVRKKGEPEIEQPSPSDRWRHTSPILGWIRMTFRFSDCLPESKNKSSVMKGKISQSPEYLHNRNSPTGDLGVL